MTTVLDNLDPHVALKMISKLKTSPVMEGQLAHKLRVVKSHPD